MSYLASVSVLVAIVLSCHGHTAAVAQDSRIGISDLEQETIDTSRRHAEVLKKLGNFALDATRTGGERRRAFALVGKMGGEDAAKFLAIHRTLLVPTDVDGDEDMEWQWPAREALADMGWAGVPALLGTIGATKPDDRTLRRDANLLERMCGEDVAIAVVRGHKATSAEWAATKDRLLKILERA